MSKEKDALIKKRKGLLITVIVLFAIMPLINLLNLPFWLDLLYASTIIADLIFIVRTQFDINDQELLDEQKDL